MTVSKPIEWTIPDCQSSDLKSGIVETEAGVWATVGLNSCTDTSGLLIVPSLLLESTQSSMGPSNLQA